MILRRLAFFIALVFAVVATQMPEYVEQYRQRLGGAIDELARIVARFDSDSAQQGLTEGAGIDRLKANGDRFVQRRGAAMEDDVLRLQSLRDAQDQLRNEGPLGRVATLVTHYDSQVARGTFSDFQPAVPTSPEAFVFGAVGFLFGGGIVHMAGRPLRRRLRETRTA